MVTTLRDQEAFLLEPGNQSNDPQGRPQQYGFILVVEDDAPTLRLERVILEEEGYTVEVVGSGEEAVAAVAEKTPTLVLLDIGLPGMDGFATCAKIRELSRVPIIMVTGRDCLDDKVKGMDVGADDYVTKPFLTHELATRVKVVLRRADATAQGEKDAKYFESVVQETSESTTPQPASSNEPNIDAQVQETVDTPEAAEEATPAPSEEEIEESPSHPSNEESQEDSQEDSMESEEEFIEPPRLPASETGIYEGTVRLTVSTLGPVRNLINFVSELRQSPQFRLLRLVANQHKEGMDIWLGLREPLELLTVLGNIAGVNDVETGSSASQNEDEQLLLVTLD